MRAWQKLSREREREFIRRISIDDNFWVTEKKLDSTLESIGVSLVHIYGDAQHSRASNAKGKLKKVLNVYKENISAAYNTSDVEIEEPSPIYDRDTKNKA